MLSVRQAKQPLTERQSSLGKAINLDDLDVREEHWYTKPKVVDHIETLPLFYDNKERTGTISLVLSRAENILLVECFKGNLDVFAWSTTDMPGVDLQVKVHRLNVLPQVKPVK